jgi:hypothetical protein
MAIEWENNLSVFGFIQGSSFRKDFILKKELHFFCGYS